MQITDILRPEGICLQGVAANKAEIIHAMVDLMQGCGVLSDAEVYENAVLARETEGTTGLGGGFGIPHAKSMAVKAPGLVAMTLRNAVDFASLDGAPVRLLFMIAAPEDANDMHVRLLSKLATLLMDNSFCERLIQAETPEEFLHLIALQEKANDMEREAQRAAPKAEEYEILAVTSCPAGIAHTYMAAEALREKAKELGISFWVETDGAVGCENVLTTEQIRAAKCIIVAADRAVEMERFAGKPLLRVTVSDALQKPERLLKIAMAGDAPLYQSVCDTAAPPQDAAVSAEDQPCRRKKNNQGGSLRRTPWQALYAHVMNGVSHMLPFVTGSGILIAMSYLFDGTNIGTANFGTGTTLAWMMRTVGEMTLNMVYPVLAGYIAVSIGDVAALLPGIAGGYLAEIGMTTYPQSQWVPSGYWGALIAGFAAGYVVLGLQWLFAKLPDHIKQVRATLLYPFMSLILIGILMTCVINPPVGQFNQWLYVQLNHFSDGSVIVLGTIMAGLMAIDFGGPINKASYLFATVALTAGHRDLMAACMLGGMVPSIGVALACTLFKKQFTSSERQTVITNYVLGASFVTEGALPFAIKDPLRVIPSCVAGAALSGGLAVALECGVPAPHGGLFLLPLATNRDGLLIALAAGSLLTAVLMGVLRMKLAPPNSEKENAEEHETADAKG